MLWNICLLYTSTVPFTAEQLENIIAQYPTPFHIYDEEGIIENMKAFINAFSWNKGFKQYFAVKATPNPVSYTHLDVYKRQIMSLVSEEIE